jgi:alpha-amylase
MTKMSFLALVLAITNTARAATAAEWRSRSIYQVVTDRYSLMNNSITAPCDPSLSVYCGGSWQGIINNLDYIQNMGFDAVRREKITHFLKPMVTD